MSATKLEKNEKLFIAIDGNAIVHRAYHAYPLTLTTSSGAPVNAVYGFTVMLLEILKRFDPEYIVCCFDTGKPTFRHTKFTDYKAHRKALDSTLIAQFPMVSEMVTAFNIPIVSVDGFEADDALGTLAEKVKTGKWSDQGIKMIIVSGDRDLLQLIDDDVNVCLPQGNFKSLTVFNRDSTKERYGYYPEQVVDYKGIVGDASDNIPGINGIGEKSATELLEKYGSFDEIYKHLSELKPRQAKLFAEGIEQAEFSRDLATISKDCPMNVMLEECLMRDFSKQKIVDEFIKYEFKSLIDKIPGQEVQTSSVKNQTDSHGGAQFSMFGGGEDFSSSNEVGEGEGQDLNDEALAVNSKYCQIDISELVQNVSKSSSFYSVFVESSESIDGKEFIIIMDGSDRANTKNFSVIHVEDLVGEQLNSFTDLIVNSARETYTFNLEEFAERIQKFDSRGTSISLMNKIAAKVTDLRLLAHLLSAGSRGFDFSSLVFEYLSRSVPTKFSVNDAPLILDSVVMLKEKMVEKSKAVDFSPFIKMNVRKVIEKYDKKGILDIEDHFDNLLLDFSVNYETRVALILPEMEQRGIKIDIVKLKILKTQIEEKLKNLEKQVFDFVGHEFNLNSPKQLSGILYTTLNLPKIGKGKKALSTDEDTLNELQSYSEVITPILEYRESKKLLGTYVDAFLDILALNGDKADPIIHTDYKLTGASSGRLSSLNPNLQNLPLKGEYAGKFREVFIPRKGYKFASIDYSQIELRMMAEISQDKDLLEIFKNNADIHRATAAKIFNVTEDQVTKEQRQAAKTVVFGVLYGQTAYGLSRQLNISREEASTYITEYFNKYQGVALYIDEATKKAQRLGYVESMFGRRRYITGLNADNRMVRAAAIREAVNMPLQGSAADLMKMGMIVVDNVIKQEFAGKAFLLLQVHDELVFEVAPEVMGEFEKQVCAAMEGVVDFSVPLEVHFSVGANLAELK